jgi:Na+-driven multidrug efflux pump
MIAFFFSATVVTLLQYMRLREKRLLPLAFLFALTAAAHCFTETHALWILFHVAAGCAGLVLLFMLSPRHTATR